MTLFEVGKLADEQMRDFLEQLECVSFTTASRQISLNIEV